MNQNQLFIFNQAVKEFADAGRLHNLLTWLEVAQEFIGCANVTMDDCLAGSRRVHAHFGVVKVDIVTPGVTVTLNRPGVAAAIELVAQEVGEE